MFGIHLMIIGFYNKNIHSRPIYLAALIPTEPENIVVIAANSFNVRSTNFGKLD